MAGPSSPPPDAPLPSRRHDAADRDPDLATRRLAELQTLYRMVPVGLAFLDADLRFVRVNERLAVINGRPVADHVGRTLREVLPELAGRLEPVCRTVLETGEPVLGVEFHGRTAAEPAVERDWLASYHPVRGAAGVVLGVGVVVQEVTEQKRTERALRAENAAVEELAHTLDLAPVLIRRLDGTITFWNEGARELYGWTGDEAVGRVAHDLFGTVFPESPAAIQATLLATGRWRGEVRHHRKDRSEMAIATLWTLHRDPARGSPVVIEVNVDVTDRKRAEEALRESEARLAGIIGSAMDAILSFNADQRVVLFNAAAERMFGMRATEAMGESLDRFIPPRFRAAHRAHVRRFGETGETSRSMGGAAALTALRADGKEFPIEASISQVEVDGQKVYTVIIRNITERVALEEAARQADKLAVLGTMSAGVAHEINNPVGIITSRIELMLEDAERQRLPEEVRDDLQVLQRHADRVAKIARGLLSFARRAPSVKVPIDVNAVVEDTLMLVGKQATNEGVTIRRDLSADLPAVAADAMQLTQVLLNLVTNAREAMPRGGVVRIDTGPDPERPGWVRVRVSDDGPGIPRDLLSRVFDPFFTTKSSGTGLGLSVSYGIVRDHGGLLAVESQAGAGATFTISLPPAPGPA